MPARLCILQKLMPRMGVGSLPSGSRSGGSPFTGVIPSQTRLSSLEVCVPCSPVTRLVCVLGRRGMCSRLEKQHRN